GLAVWVRLFHEKGNARREADVGILFVEDRLDTGKRESEFDKQKEAGCGDKREEDFLPKRENPAASRWNNDILVFRARLHTRKRLLLTVRSRRRTHILAAPIFRFSAQGSAPGGRDEAAFPIVEFAG
ncbi:MAG: hypothetical protein O7E51_00150, partial [Acidobacteria bacterium]|nr:hypothetical protein [Acidobacteriota bacterium]